MWYRWRFLMEATLIPGILILGAMVGAVIGHANDPRWFSSIVLLGAGGIGLLLSSRVHRWVRASPQSCTRAQYTTIVGGGWSFFLNKRGAARAVLDTRRGFIGDDWWWSGTTIGEVQSHLVKRGQTLSSHPSVLSGTLGGWLFSNSHGSGGTLWTPQFVRARVHDQDTGDMLEVEPKRFFNPRTPTADQRRYVIHAVKLAHVPNTLCKRTAFRLFTRDDANSFLTTPSYLRLLMIGRRGTLGLLWTPTFEQPTPSISKQRLWFQADVLSTWQSASGDNWGWPMEPYEQWTSVVSLAQANDFAIAPIPLFGILAFGYRNFELFVDRAPTPDLIVRLCRRIEACLEEGGRCELRCGRSRVFLDFACPMSLLPSDLVRHVCDEVGLVPIFLHKGKAQISWPPLVGDPT